MKALCFYNNKKKTRKHQFYQILVRLNQLSHKGIFWSSLKYINSDVTYNYKCAKEKIILLKEYLMKKHVKFEAVVIMINREY